MAYVLKLTDTMDSNEYFDAVLGAAVQIKNKDECVTIEHTRTIGRKEPRIETVTLRAEELFHYLSQNNNVVATKTLNSFAQSFEDSTPVRMYNHLTYTLTLKTIDSKIDTDGQLSPGRTPSPQCKPAMNRN